MKWKKVGALWAKMTLHWVLMLVGLWLTVLGCTNWNEAERSEAVAAKPKVPGPRNNGNDHSQPVSGRRYERLVVSEFASPQQFKVPVAKGYNWEVSQSWSDHCQICLDKGYTDWDYCDNSMSHRLNCCKYGIDFNLPGDKDKGKPVLASADGSVKEASYSAGWGNYLVIDHGSDICTRYAHMQDDSVTVSEGDTVCQGLLLGKIGTTGNSSGEHLHFQFESCSDGEGLAMGFSDGNGIPVCTRGSDVFASDGSYDFLKLTNELRNDCEPGEDLFTGDQLPRGGWYSQACGSIPGCPLRPNCDRSTNHLFGDDALMIERTRQAAAYLYSECAIDGKADGELHILDNITKAEALKISLYLYGLMDNCGVEMPFRDVDVDDWFFPVVACALRHGIVSNIVEYFSPNEEIGFGEAAKYLVEAASRAGVIEIQDPPVEHFGKILKNNPAFRYVETLYTYGGLVNNYWNASAEEKVERRGFVIMAASLSPCFCGNVSCTDRCICDQAVYACVDPSNVSDGLGGSSSDEGSEDDSQGAASPDRNHVGRELDLDIACSVESDNVRCEGRETVLYIKCTLANRAADQVNINNLQMQMSDEDDAEHCQVRDPDLRSGNGVNVIEAGEQLRPSGHFEISCEQMPEDGELEVTFDLVERVSGVVTNHPGILADSVQVGAEVFDLCAAAPQAAGEAAAPSDEGEGAAPGGGAEAQGAAWHCDPRHGYVLQMLAQGGSYEIVTAVPELRLQDNFQAGVVYDVHFNCEELPAVILMHGASDNLRVWRSGPTLPAFEVWADYRGPLTTSPPMRPDVIVTSFSITVEDKDILVRVPPG